MLALYWLALVLPLQSLLSSVCRPARCCLFSCIAIVRLSSCRSCLFRSIAIDMLALYWLALVCTLSSVLASVYRPAGYLLAIVGLHSVKPASVRLSPCRSYLFSCIAVALQELSIQLYCYRPAGYLLASVGLHSAERAIVGLSPCWVRLFSCIAIDMLALYWLALVCTLQSLLSFVCRPAGCCLF